MPPDSNAAAITSRTDATTVQEVFAAGADDFVGKPFVGPELGAHARTAFHATRLPLDAPGELAPADDAHHREAALGTDGVGRGHRTSLPSGAT